MKYETSRIVRLHDVRPVGVQTELKRVKNLMMMVLLLLLLGHRNRGSRLNLLLVLMLLVQLLNGRNRNRLHRGGRR